MKLSIRSQENICVPLSSAHNPGNPTLQLYRTVFDFSVAHWTLPPALSPAPSWVVAHPELPIYDTGLSTLH